MLEWLRSSTGGLRRFVRGDGVAEPAGTRTRGVPTSSNRASSLHLRWLVDGPLSEVGVSLTVVEPPTVDRLYFWALQADFTAAGGRPAGGAHLGLQWHPSYPGSTAVNWGGYGPSGGELRGTASGLPSALANPNTRDLAWSAGTPTELRIFAVEEPGGDLPAGFTAWRATVDGVVVRDLFVPGGAISGAVVWSEVFARCDDPAVGVEWSHPLALDPTGARLPVTAASVNYQTHAQGGCTNTNSDATGTGLLQRTNTARTTRQGTVLAWPSPQPHPGV